MSEPRMKQADRAAQVKAMAEAMAATSGSVRLSSLASALGLSARYIQSLCRGMTLAGWTVKITGQTIRRGPVPGTVSEKGLERPDRRVISKLLRDARKGMGDGRAEVDEPPLGMPTRSGKQHLAAPLTEAEARAKRARACRGFLREYRRIRSGKRKPGPRKFAEHRSIQGVSMGQRLPWSTCR